MNVVFGPYNRKDKTRQTATGTDIEPSSVWVFHVINELEAILDMAVFEFGQGRRCDKVDRLIPLAQKVSVQLEPLFGFT